MEFIQCRTPSSTNREANIQTLTKAKKKALRLKIIVQFFTGNVTETKKGTFLGYCSIYSMKLYFFKTNILWEHLNIDQTYRVRDNQQIYITYKVANYI